MSENYVDVDYLKNIKQYIEMIEHSIIHWSDGEKINIKECIDHIYEIINEGLDD